MTKSIFNRATGYWRRTTYWDRHDIKEARLIKAWKGQRINMGRKKVYQYKPVTGKWQSLFIKKCRETGYVHTEGPLAGKPNLYRLSIETQISRDALNKLLTGKPPGISLLGKLCDAFHCQPNDFLKRVTQDEAVTPSKSLPATLTEDDLPGDEYVLP